MIDILSRNSCKIILSKIIAKIILIIKAKHYMWSIKDKSMLEILANILVYSNEKDIKAVSEQSLRFNYAIYRLYQDYSWWSAALRLPTWATLVAKETKSGVFAE